MDVNTYLTTRRLFAKRVKKLGIAEFDAHVILALINDNNTPRLMTVGDITKIIGCLPAQMSRSLRWLEELKLIVCHLHDKDRRRIVVQLTGKGRLMAEQLAKVIE